MPNNSVQLSDAKTADFLQTVVDDLRTGEKARDEMRDELLAVLCLEDPAIVKDGPLRTQGRLSFGADHSYRGGVGLFIPDDALSNFSEEENNNDE